LSINEFFSIVPGFEAGYHLGLTNTYSNKELSKEAEALNALSYNISGTRKHRGFECGITISIPLANFKKTKLPEPEPMPEPEKLCYTIDEIKDLIRTRQNIHGKRICAVKQVSFKFGSSELTAQDKVYLDEMVILMETNELINIRVNGHTDNVGGEEFNMNLSRDRAKSVHDYLKSRGIAAGRLSFAYFGSTRPIADNYTEEGRAINRRVEFEIINQ
jgi:OOP family OmpA-OmpF porin